MEKPPFGIRFKAACLFPGQRPPLFEHSTTAGECSQEVVMRNCRVHFKFPLLNRTRQCYKPDRLLSYHKAQLRPHSEDCCEFRAGAPQYELPPLDRIQYRVRRIVGDHLISGQLDALDFQKNIAFLSMLNRIYYW
ncbi:hypothetical protein EVAR_56702_1 [Eumeta japonica]|uniref:Uncharacterized protein n=1 Tax=Eumeta variegata TaxID=151549 RepID=A0A4C1XYZ0_EUMVA|nr:hypothetical protein EVAR_56702_1 [Eumeta japonica]